MGEKTVNSLKEFVGVLEMIDPNQEVFFVVNQIILNFARRRFIDNIKVKWLLGLTSTMNVCLLSQAKWILIL
ncbi:hypothetical protein [Weissella confusa]|uniref:hypothetical protein n=1 Tax=Weissella confusa TaxID=1583 RepID=UPI00223B0F68|nr:hypothetical protein [Weissella confusa]